LISTCSETEHKRSPKHIFLKYKSFSYFGFIFCCHYYSAAEDLTLV